MAQRVLSTNFWTDNWVEELEPVEKLVFIYLITNPLNNIAGVYKIHTKRIAYETGMEKNEIEKILQKFCDAKKIIRHEEWMVIVNFIKNQSKNPKVENGIKRIVETLPESLFIAIYESLWKPLYSLSPLSAENSAENLQKTGKMAQIEAPETPESSEKTPQENYWDPDIDAIIKAISDFHGTCDGTQAEQRKYGKHLKNKIAKIKGFDGNFSRFIQKICEKTSKFHITKTTSPKAFYENLGVLISAIKSQNLGEFSPEKSRELSAEDIKNHEEKIRIRQRAEAKKERENDEKRKKEKAERQEILKFFRENLAENLRAEIEKKADEKFENLPVKKWDLAYEIEIVRQVRPHLSG